jgi:hypothetical protein
MTPEHTVAIVPDLGGPGYLLPGRAQRAGSGEAKAT